MSIPATLGNEMWVRSHANQIKAIFPENWTLIQDLDVPYVGLQLRLLGIHWRNQDELTRCFFFFERVGITQRIDWRVRRAP